MSYRIEDKSYDVITMRDGVPVDKSFEDIKEARLYACDHHINNEVSTGVVGHESGIIDELYLIRADK